MSSTDSISADNFSYVYPDSDGYGTDDFQITRQELDNIQDALKKEEFRKLLSEYVDEVQDPTNQATYQKEIRQLELERGNIVHFLNPIPSYVLKTSVNGEKKAFINICGNPLIRKPSVESVVKGKKKGSLFSMPYAQSQPREDFDKAGAYCLVYDVIFHPMTIELAKENMAIRDKVESTSLEAIEKSFNVSLDKNNIRRPKLKYKGATGKATVIKYKVGEDPPYILDIDAASNQEIAPQDLRKVNENVSKGKSSSAKHDATKQKSSSTAPSQPAQYTKPSYKFKYRDHIDLQNYCIDNQRNGNSCKPIPEEIVLEVNLPLLKDSSTLDADVVEDGWFFELKSSAEKAKYELRLKLPFQVWSDRTKAKFDKDSRKLTIVMKCMQKVQKLDVKRRISDDEVLEESFNSIDTDEETAGSSGSPLHEKKSKPLIEVLSESDSGVDEKYVEEILESRAAAGEKTEKPESVFHNKTSDFQNSDVKADSSKKRQCSAPQPTEPTPSWVNGDIVIKSILKTSARSRSRSESWIDNMTRLSLDDGDGDKEPFNSLASLDESDEPTTESCSPPVEKSVRFNECVKRQLYRSNSSILGQRKKNQKKSKNKRKARERSASEGSVSSLDCDTMIMN